MTDKNGPYFLINRMTGKHHGPFTTEIDASLARAIATPDWATASQLNKKQFDAHLRDLNLDLDEGIRWA